jgi:hypothetical protein
MARMDGIFDFWKTREAPQGVHRDLYTILEVSPSASSEEIRAAYRRLAARYHPDRNPGDESAYEKYLEITKAHDILSDPDKRDKYDRGVRGAKREERPVESGALSTHFQKPRRTERPHETQPQEAAKAKPGKKKPTLVDLIEPEKGYEYDAPLRHDLLRPQAPRRPQRSLEEVFAEQSVVVAMPSRETLLAAVGQLELPKIWDYIRKYRQDPDFLKSGSLVVGPIGPANSRSIAEDLAWISGASLEEIVAYIQANGLGQAWEDVLAPLAQQAVLAMDHVRPSDIPGYFRMDWDPSGRGLELIYSEQT